MKKLILPFAILLIILICYILFSYLPKQLGNICNLSISKETRIQFNSGDTGKKAIIADMNDIQNIFEILKKATITKQFNQRPRGGYTYMLTKYEGIETKFVIIVINNLIKVNDTYYKTDKNLANELKNSERFFQLEN